MKRRKKLVKYQKGEVNLKWCTKSSYVDTAEKEFILLVIDDYF